MSLTLLSSLQALLNQRGIDVERLTAEAMIQLMVDWFRLSTAITPMAVMVESQGLR